MSVAVAIYTHTHTHTQTRTHARTYFSGNDSTGVNRRVGGSKLFLEHFRNSIASEFRNTIRAEVRDASALLSDGREKKNAVLVSIGAAEVPFLSSKEWINCPEYGNVA